jgi:biotin synthase-related radical SAM superfamily protein
MNNIYLLVMNIQKISMHFQTGIQLSTLFLLKRFTKALFSYCWKGVEMSQVFLYVSVKKETLQLQGFEKALLSSYKIYLQRLEKLVSMLKKKHGNSQMVSQVK